MKNGSNSSVKSVVLRHERKKLELKREKARAFLEALKSEKSTTIVWQIVALDSEVQRVENELAVLTARRMALWSETMIASGLDAEE